MITTSFKNDSIRIIKHAFSNEECDSIIKLAIENYNACDGTIYQGKVDLEQRRSKVRYIPKTDEKFKFVFDRLWSILYDVKLDMGILQLNTIQVAEYNSEYSGMFNKHKDTHSPNVLHRRISGVVQLTDRKQYKGGELKLYARKIPESNELDEKGTIILFPSLMFHSVTPVTQGNRYSLACWFEGERYKGLVA